jgi:hypothetical protein
MSDNTGSFGVRTERASRLSWLFVASLVVAFGAFSLNESLGMHWWYLKSNHMYTELILRVIAPAVAWLLLLSAGLKLHRWRGLWLLVGAPLALYWPYRFAALFLGCWTGTAPGYMC